MSNETKILVSMPNEYSTHPIVLKIQEMLQNETDDEFEIFFTLSGFLKKINSFILSIFSPVFSQMVRGTFLECSKKQIQLVDVNELCFQNVMDLYFGKTIEVESVRMLMQLAKFANMFQVPMVEYIIENTIIQQLTAANCIEIFETSLSWSLHRTEEASLRLASFCFDELASTEKILHLSETALETLLDQDDLVASSEENILEFLVRWMNESSLDSSKGLHLLQKIRANLIDGRRLQAALGKLSTHPCGFSEDSLAASILRSSKTAPRARRGILWSRYNEGGERRLSGHPLPIRSLVLCRGRVCTASDDGSILVWTYSPPSLHQVLQGSAVHKSHCLASWQGLLVSSSGEGLAKLWDVETGICLRVFICDFDPDRPLIAVCGDLLAGFATNRTIKVWSMHDGPALTQESTLTGCGMVLAMQAGGGRLVCACLDRCLRVWELPRGRQEAILYGHGDWVRWACLRDSDAHLVPPIQPPNVRVTVGDFTHQWSLALTPHWLFSASDDGTLRMWGVGPSWPLLRVAKLGAQPESRPHSLAVCGARVVCGVGHRTSTRDRVSELRVFRIDTLELDCTIPQAGPLFGLLALDGQVWAGRGNEVVVWGDAGPPPPRSDD